MDRFLRATSSSSSSRSGAAAVAAASPVVNLDEVMEDDGGAEGAEEEQSESGSANGGEMEALASNAAPPNKKRKFAVCKDRRKEKHTFQKAWQNGRLWLRYDGEKGMWCAVCHQFRQNPSVAGSGNKKNALCNPTKVYTFRNVKNHAEGSYHTRATALVGRLDTSVAAMPLALPTAVTPQVKVLFRTVLYMVRNGIGHQQLKRLMHLQKENGVKYDLKYHSHYVPVVLHFLAAACKDFVRQKWAVATWRSVMVDEVKVGDQQWLSCTACVSDGAERMMLVIGAGRFEDEGRDATAVADTMSKALAAFGVDSWLDERLVALCVDGASVLLSGLHSEVAQQAPNVLRFYCASHRTQRVDNDVTEVPKRERQDASAMAVRKVARKLNRLLSQTARFFKVSTKRWAELRRKANQAGYHLNHGPLRQRSRGQKQKRLLRYKALQHTRFIYWKRWASHVWLNNLAALVIYLQSATFPRKQEKKARNLLKKARSLLLVTCMVIYERWAAVLTTLSLSTQAVWSVLPTLHYSVGVAMRRLQRLQDVTEQVILDVKVDEHTYHGVQVEGGKEDLKTMAEWAVELKDRTLAMLNKRFDTAAGGLLWSASLFDRRTWPADLKFDPEVVQKQLDALQKNFPACKKLKLYAGDFVRLAKIVQQDHPPTRSASGRIRASDALRTWNAALRTVKEGDLQPMLKCAAQLCCVIISQSSCEQLIQGSVWSVGHCAFH